MLPSAKTARRSGSSGVQLLALVAMLGLAVVVIRTVASKQANQKGNQAEEVAVDPFEGLDREEVPVARKLKPRKARSESFAGVAGPEDSEAWTRSREKAQDAIALVKIASSALANGDRPLAREKGDEAKKLLEEALEESRPWEEELTATLGPNARQTKRVVNTRTSWRRELMAIRKGVR